MKKHKKFKIEEVNGSKRLIIKLVSLENKLTIEKLFEIYTSKRKHVKFR